MRTALIAVLLLSTLAGCAYYEVTEPASGRIYYPHNGEIKRFSNGSIEFVDARTGAKITLQSSEIHEIPKERYIMLISDSSQQ